MGSGYIKSCVGINGGVVFDIYMTSITKMHGTMNIKRDTVK